jgi:hypothetical protein
MLAPVYHLSLSLSHALLLLGASSLSREKFLPFPCGIGLRQPSVMCQTIRRRPHGYRAGPAIFPLRVRFEPKNVKVHTRNVPEDIFERLDARCCPPRRSQADMRKIATKFRFFPRDRGIYAPLVHGTPSCSYSTMSHPAPTAVPEPVSPGARKDDTVFIDSPLVSSRTYDEPIVTRKELWSYYRKSVRRRVAFPGTLRLTAFCYSQYITMETTCVLIILLSVRDIVEISMRVGGVYCRVLARTVSVPWHVPQD